MFISFCRFGIRSMAISIIQGCEIAFEAGIALSSRSKKNQPQIIIQCSLFLFFVIDLFAVYSTGVKNGDTANTQVVYLLPYNLLVSGLYGQSYALKD